ncbi:hypothetical protein [Moorena sp. SIO2C4]|nr:hypothetical protein [Moorena sp. SIO2C4]
MRLTFGHATRTHSSKTIGAYWWNGHIGGTGILVERASCPYPAYR